MRWYGHFWFVSGISSRLTGDTPNQIHPSDLIRPLSLCIQVDSTALLVHFRLCLWYERTEHGRLLHDRKSLATLSTGT